MSFSIFSLTYIFAGSKSAIARVSNHPVHMQVDGDQMPSTLVPFCSYALGRFQSDPTASFPACTNFTPVILDGQQCYQIEVGHKAEAGKREGLIMLVDTNRERSVETKAGNSYADTDIRTESNFNHVIHNGFKVFVENKENGRESGSRIYINTLQKFSAHEDGSYVIKNIKKMSATNNFLSMKTDVRKCQVERFEECRMRNYISAVVERCGCVPLAMVASMSEMVRVVNYFINFNNM